MAGLHVELSCSDRKLETLPKKIGADPWHALSAKLVEVHIGAEASALLFSIRVSLFG